MARELSEQRLQAAQSKFEVGMATNFEVVQAQRDLADARSHRAAQHPELPQGDRRFPAFAAGRHVTHRDVHPLSLTGTSCVKLCSSWSVAALGVDGRLQQGRRRGGGRGQPRLPAPAAAARGGAGGRGGRPPMPVEFAVVKRAPVAEQILVVGNLIGAATVQVVPRVNGRLATVNVQLGDSVRRGQTVAKVEDLEIQEQVRQAEAAYKVSEATIRQRDGRPQARHHQPRPVEEPLRPAAAAAADLRRHRRAATRRRWRRTTWRNAQFEQAKARLEELKITLDNTIITSPVDGFVSKRFSDPGAFVGPNSPVVAVVDIRTVRMVANLVEKDMKRVPVGTSAAVEVDAFPGEKFAGRVSRVAPVFDPATRTAEMEIEIPNSSYRLKPGHVFARVS